MGIGDSEKERVAMHHFFAEPAQITGDVVCLTGSDVNHIRNVLRMEAGARFTLSDGQSSRLYTCRITSVEKEKIWAAIESVSEEGTELPSRIWLFQGLPKSDKMDWIVQKAVELGVYGIVPVMTKRTVVRLDAKKEKARCARWNAIAEGAAKQSGRMLVPQVKEPVSFAQALQMAQDMQIQLIPYELAGGMEKTRRIFSQIAPGQSVAVFIGPEGGFEEEEVCRAEEAGFVRVTLGKRILRTETAGLSALAMLGYVLEQ